MFQSILVGVRWLFFQLDSPNTGRDSKKGNATGNVAGFEGSFVNNRFAEILINVQFHVVKFCFLQFHLSNRQIYSVAKVSYARL